MDEINKAIEVVFSPSGLFAWIAGVVFLAVTALRLYGASLWARVPSWAQPMVPTALAALAALGTAGISGASWQEAGKLAFQSVAAAVFAHHTIKRLKQ